MTLNTSSQDRVIAARPLRQRRFVWAAVALAIVGLSALAWPGLQGFAAAGNSVSAERLSLAVVEVGPLLRDIAADGKVVAANSPTLYAPAGGAAAMQVQVQVHAGDTVKRGQVLAVIDSSELAALLAQERSNADAMRADVLRAQVEARRQTALLQRDWENAGIDLKTAQTDLEKARLTLAHAAAGRGLKEDSLKFDVQAKQAASERQQLLVKDLLRQVA